MSHTWSHIQDYDDDPTDLAQSELRPLADVWNEQRERLEAREAFVSFNTRLKREWAIETGLIERLYVLDRGITEVLIERGIDGALIPHREGQDSGTVASMISDHEAVVDGIFRFVKGDRDLSTSYIKEMHALITRNQAYCDAVDAEGRRSRVRLIHGDYKQWPNNPQRPDGSFHEYCPPEHVAAEMDQLIALHSAHTTAPPEVEAAWLHHRFAQIHPFQDGNGRIARALGTLVLVKAGWFPLVVRNDDRDRYLDASEVADAGNIRPLVKYFADLQKDEFIKALSIVRDVLDSVRAEQAIRAVRRQLQNRRDALKLEWQDARTVANILWEAARDRLEEVREELEREMQHLLAGAGFFVDSVSDHQDRSHYYRWQIVQAARELRYWANTETYRSWSRLVMRSADGDQSELLVTFHGLGQEFQGLLACSVVYLQRVTTEAGERQVADPEAVADNVFQINYKEPAAEARGRFSSWLEPCLVRGLDRWQSTVL